MKNKNNLTSNMQAHTARWMRLTILVFMLIAGALLKANAQDHKMAAEVIPASKPQEASQQKVSDPAQLNSTVEINATETQMTAPMNAESQPVENVKKKANPAPIAPQEMELKKATNVNSTEKKPE